MIKRTWLGWIFAAAILTSLIAPPVARAAVAKTPALPHSPVMHGGQPPAKFTADISGMKTLTLVATGYSWGQAVWGEPVLIAPNGSVTPLTKLQPINASVSWGEFSINHGPDHQPLNIGGKVLSHGLFAHADSCVTYALDGKYVRFEAWVGINHTAGNRGAVVFELKDEAFMRDQRLRNELGRAFTKEALVRLRADLENERLRGPHYAARADELLSRLATYEKEFDAIRAEIDGQSQLNVERLEAFIALVHDLRAIQLDAPLLFVKRFAYHSGHIYDDYFTWHPGGGIYVIENPAAPLEKQIVRAVIDPSTKETLGPGVYRDPSLSYDAKKLLFAFKGEPTGDTSIYEIGIDGTGLRRLTYPGRDCQYQEKAQGLVGTGQHDIKPCYLPDGRIVFTSTRTGAHVMCFSSHIDILHTMNADGSDIRSISVNNQNEFNPTVLPNGRILYGRWEYVDKTALYMQSLWTINPDGTEEKALFKNNMAKPTAVLHAKPVPNSNLIVASLTPHNGQSVGAIAMIDPMVGKNSLAAITNFTPEYPTEMDQGVVFGPSDPWPLSANLVLIANNAKSHGPHGVIEMIDRMGFRSVIHREKDIDCYNPMLVKPRPVPPVIPSSIVQGQPSTFFIHDIYQGLSGVPRGQVKQLRVIETTARISGIPPGGRWWNQAFLVSWQGSYDIKNFLGVVPVEEDGSAYFEAPTAKALYFQALDQNGRLVQSMRTFVQAVPGVTRSCMGCHIADENEAPVQLTQHPLAILKPPAKIATESWGDGFLDYPTMVQPILDRHCVRCHGGKEGISAGIDLTGGWTWAFNISYETLIKNTLTGFLNCHNGSVKTAELLPPRAHGSGSAPLADLIMSGHNGRLSAMSAQERNLVMAWMDENCNYHGNWNYTQFATCNAILPLRDQLIAQMRQGGCVRCHQEAIGNDWINLQTPEFSRILRAPLAAGGDGLGLAWCRERKAKPVRVPLVDQHVQPPDVFRPVKDDPRDASGAPVIGFANTSSPAYQAMLAIIRKGQEEALKAPRVDMPGAKIVLGKCRDLAPLAPPGCAVEANIGLNPKHDTCRNPAP